ncbi:uncharacterized protein LOC122016220 isoform X2 [Zingiber officinale]|uniref:uncharacterized protein LOC122016220 isoform X2 n=1 Tax=Zingiber officinale TaxID=94328 RepID=UPI001C4AE7DE|nr:uncharacterized protein LOC122016220 isoform X2 [Zingiber officinale]
MVLWELTAITAYFLGLKRTYRLALRLQRRLVGPNHPRIRQFIHRRTRKVFDVAVTVHKNIQQRDIEVYHPPIATCRSISQKLANLTESRRTISKPPMNQMGECYSIP